MYEDHKDQVQFFVVYIREAHALDSRSPNTFGMVEDPITAAERTAVASKCMIEMKLDMIPALIDRMDDRVNKAYQAQPDRLYLVGKDGKIAYAGGRGPRGFRPEELEAAIKVELKKIKTTKKAKEDKTEKAPVEKTKEPQSRDL